MEVNQVNCKVEISVCCSLFISTYTYTRSARMFFDLFVPFPLPQSLSEPTKKKKDKGKGKVQGNDQQDTKNEREKEYWPSITQMEKERCTKSMALAGHRT